MRVLFSGLWICAVTIASCYAAVTFGGGFFSKSTEPYLEGLQYQKLAPINIPMVADGKVQGYVIAVLVFTGLTAWDTQRAKSDYLTYGATEQAEKLAIMSALSLYLSLVNLFQLLLAFFGQREEA